MNACKHKKISQLQPEIQKNLFRKIGPQELLNITSVLPREKSDPYSFNLQLF